MSKNTKLNINKSQENKERTIAHAKQKKFVKISNAPLNKILHLQRKIGNKTVQRLFKSGILQAKLKIGKPVNRVISMREKRT